MVYSVPVVHMEKEVVQDHRTGKVEMQEAKTMVATEVRLLGHVADSEVVEEGVMIVVHLELEGATPEEEQDPMEIKQEEVGGHFATKKLCLVVHALVSVVVTPTIMVM